MILEKNNFRNVLSRLQFGPIMMEPFDPSVGINTIIDVISMIKGINDIIKSTRLVESRKMKKIIKVKITFIVF